MSSDKPTQDPPEDQPEGKPESPKPQVDLPAEPPKSPKPQVDPPEGQSGSPKPQVDPRIQARRTGVRTRRRLRVWISIGVIAVLAAAAYGVTQSRLMDVDEIEVIGAGRTSTAQVLEAAGIELGTPLLGLDLSGPRRSIAALPWVDQVRSSRTWGGKVTFDITEREAVAQIPVGEEWALVDREGRVLQVNPVRGALPVVQFTPVPQPGGWLHGLALPLLEVSEALIPVQQRDIGAISLMDGKVVVDLPGEGRAHWGAQDDPHGKADSLARILAEVDMSCVEIVDLSIPELPALTPIDDCS